MFVLAFLLYTGGDGKNAFEGVNRTEEIELKLSLAPDQVESFLALPRLGAASAAAEQVSTYYDTPEGHLRKAGFSLRVRRKGRRYVQTLKEGGGDAGGFSARGEWERRIGGPELDLGALADTPLAPLLVRKTVRDRLETASETRVHRTTWQIAQDSSLIELILDVGEVVAGGRREPICEIELELKRGSRNALFDMAREIGRDISLRLGVTSKSERGAALASRRPRRVFKAEPVELVPKTAIADAFAVIVRSCLRHFRRNEPAAGAEPGIEGVHQLRVAIRRLRSAFSLFGPVIGGPEADCLRDELKGLSGLLGDARDVDVTIELLRRPGGDRKAVSIELRRLRRTRARAYDALAARLASNALPGLLLDLAAWAEVGSWRERPRAQRSIDAFAEERLGRLWRKVRKAGKEIGEADVEGRHRLRIDVKKLRYASEFFAGLALGGDRRRWKDFVEQLEQLQESLGALNDIATASRAAAAESTPRDRAALLRAAERSYDRLREIGPYWR